MGAYSYCRHPGCDAEMNKATLQEIAEGVQRCYNGHENEPNVSLAEAFQDLQDRVDSLEDDVETLQRQVRNL